MLLKFDNVTDCLNVQKIYNVGLLDDLFHQKSNSIISIKCSSSSSIVNVNIITPTSRGDILRQLFPQCISYESNT